MDTYYQGIFYCKCDENFDPSTNCMSCNPGFQNIKGKCIPDSCIKSGLECSDHGYCKLSGLPNQINKCVCDEDYAGKYCDTCQLHGRVFRVDTGACIKRQCVHNYTECSNNGKCQENESGWACNCNIESSGKKCEQCEIGYIQALNRKCVHKNCLSENLECNGRGICVHMSSTHGCLCDTNFNSASKCRDCEVGFKLSDGVCVQIRNKSASPMNIMPAICLVMVCIMIGPAVLQIIFKQKKVQIIVNEEINEKPTTENAI